MDASAETIPEQLLAWYDVNRRTLPWRSLPGAPPPDPYRVWLSEVMLQQTTTAAVAPYYARFLARWPDVAALAAADEAEVMAAWAGLGYYARARNLHKAAQAALSAHGALPRTAAALAELPGFGPYTANAVASLAFGEQVPLVDGNVGRVLSRVLRLPGDPAAVRALAWEAAPALLPAGKAGVFNEALMELGATVCTPRAPDCAECPLAKLCGAGKQGDAERFPAPKRQRARPQVEWAAVCVRRDDGAVLLARHAPGERGALFAGLWDLPSVQLGEVVPLPEGPLFAGAAAKAALGALRARGLPVEGLRLRPLGAVEQALTHRELRVHLFAVALGEGAPLAKARLERETVRWVAPTAEALGALGLSSLARKSLRACGVAAPRGATGAAKPAAARRRRQ